LDIGLVPLATHSFNETKSWLKGLEYASVGVPFIASDTEPYRALAALGLGDIARRPKDWTRAVCRLVSDRAYRQDRADTYFEIAKTLTIERNAWRFLEAWSGS
jgi:glycosyltransferase involved in cell wall biosynthesis